MVNPGLFVSKIEYNQFLKENFKRNPRKSLKRSIFSICDAVFNSGQRITVRLVRQQLGNGSHSTISKYIGLWRAEKFSKAKEKVMEDFFKESAEVQNRVREKLMIMREKMSEENLKGFGFESFSDEDSESFLSASEFDPFFDSKPF